MRHNRFGGSGPETPSLSEDAKTLRTILIFLATLFLVFVYQGLSRIAATEDISTVSRNILLEALSSTKLTAAVYLAPTLYVEGTDPNLPSIDSVTISPDGSKPDLLTIDAVGSAISLLKKNGYSILSMDVEVDSPSLQQKIKVSASGINPKKIEVVRLSIKRREDEMNIQRNSWESSLAYKPSARVLQLRVATEAARYVRQDALRASCPAKPIGARVTVKFADDHAITDSLKELSSPIGSVLNMGDYVIHTNHFFLDDPTALSGVSGSYQTIDLFHDARQAPHSSPACEIDYPLIAGWYHEGMEYKHVYLSDRPVKLSRWALSLLEESQRALSGKKISPTAGVELDASVAMAFIPLVMLPASLLVSSILRQIKGSPKSSTVLRLLVFGVSADKRRFSPFDGLHLRFLESLCRISLLTIAIAATPASIYLFPTFNLYPLLHGPSFSTWNAYSMQYFGNLENAVRSPMTWAMPISLVLSFHQAFLFFNNAKSRRISFGAWIRRVLSQ